jgi:hypothetical protein
MKINSLAILRVNTRFFYRLIHPTEKSPIAIMALKIVVQGRVLAANGDLTYLIIFRDKKVYCYQKHSRQPSVIEGRYKHLNFQVLVGIVSPSPLKVANIKD